VAAVTKSATWPIFVTRLAGDSPIHGAAVGHLDAIRAILEVRAEQCGATDPQATAYELQILMMGSIVSASRGDLDAARRARRVAEMLI
jgi:hypothetical protein